MCSFAHSNPDIVERQLQTSEDRSTISNVPITPFFVGYSLDAAYDYGTRIFRRLSEVIGLDLSDFFERYRKRFRAALNAGAAASLEGKVDKPR